MTATRHSSAVPGLLLWLLAALAGAAEGDAAADPARGRLARLAPPWYDAKADDWQRVEVDEPDEEEVDAHDWRLSIPGTEIVAYVLLAAVVAGLAALAVMLWRARVPGEADTGDVRAVDRAARVAVLPIAAEPGADDPEAALARALAAGDWAAAVVWLYALVLLRLDRAGVLQLAAGKTNRMYLREAEGDARSGALADAIDHFERSYFGHQPVDEASVRRLHAVFDRIDPTPVVAT